MRATFRVSIILVLVGTVLLLWYHLFSIGRQSLYNQHANQGSNVEVNEGGAHVELDSSKPSPGVISSPPTLALPIPLPTRKPLPGWSGSESSQDQSEPPQDQSEPPQDEPELPQDEWESPQDEWEFPQDEPEPSTLLATKNTTTSSGTSTTNPYNAKHADKPPKPKVSPKADRIIVMPAMDADDVSWLDDELPEWQHAVYMVEDPQAKFAVSKNKGKESNVYLQYIMDHYDNLPQYIVFMHSHRNAWHVEMENQDNAVVVQRLQLKYLNQTGYVNLRCDWGPGCPDEVRPFRQSNGRTTEIAFAGAWMRIFNDTAIPDVIAAPCCAQFAVTRDQVLDRPLSDYQSYHQWLMETELDDETSGRVFEYLWHIIFGRDPVFCPIKEQCYLDVFDTEFVPPPPEEPTLPYEEGDFDPFHIYDFEDDDAEEDTLGEGFSKENASQEDPSQEATSQAASQEAPSKEDEVHTDDQNWVDDVF